MRKKYIYMNTAGTTERQHEIKRKSLRNIDFYCKKANYYSQRLNLKSALLLGLAYIPECFTMLLNLPMHTQSRLLAQICRVKTLWPIFLIYPLLWTPSQSLQPSNGHSAVSFYRPRLCKFCHLALWLVH